MERKIHGAIAREPTMDTATNWSERTRPKHNPSAKTDHEEHANRQQFNRPRTSMGAAGHWIHMAGLFAPIVIGELVKDADKRWRYVRLASVGTALAYEAAHTIREQQRNAEREAECREHCR
ncbi:hypothetical protein [Paludibaculum fermentans]|uniref:hypothetical protein n=1 Tax=Paludibaculum fermentans TaxID=1473598 RepID=UPI003EB89484